MFGLSTHKKKLKKIYLSLPKDVIHLFLSFNDIQTINSISKSMIWKNSMHLSKKITKHILRCNFDKYNKETKSQTFTQIWLKYNDRNYKLYKFLCCIETYNFMQLCSNECLVNKYNIIDHFKDDTYLQDFSFKKNVLTKDIISVFDNSGNFRFKLDKDISFKEKSNFGERISYRLLSVNLNDHKLHKTMITRKSDLYKKFIINFDFLQWEQLLREYEIIIAGGSIHTLLHENLKFNYKEQDIDLFMCFSQKVFLEILGKFNNLYTKSEYLLIPINKREYIHEQMAVINIFVFNKNYILSQFEADDVNFYFLLLNCFLELNISPIYSNIKNKILDYELKYMFNVQFINMLDTNKYVNDKRMFDISSLLYNFDLNLSQVALFFDKKYYKFRVVCTHLYKMGIETNLLLFNSILNSSDYSNIQTFKRIAKYLNRYKTDLFWPKYVKSDAFKLIAPVIRYKKNDSKIEIMIQCNETEIRKYIKTGLYSHYLNVMHECLLEIVYLK